LFTMFLMRNDFIDVCRVVMLYTFNYAYNRLSSVQFLCALTTASFIVQAMIERVHAFWTFLWENKQS
jgi:hypothetical protein